MKKLPLVLALALVVLFALAGGAAAKKPSARTGSLLFVSQSQGGSIEPLGPKAYELSLTGISPEISLFTDRPRRRAGIETVAEFVRNWRAEGFAADPPNAALVIAGAPNGRDVAMVTLSKPRYDRAGRALKFRAVPLKGRDAGALADFARRGDPLRAGGFGRASLFVDDGGEARYYRFGLQVQGVQAGQQVRIELSPTENGGRVAWSTGPPGQGDAGIQLNPLGPPIPISQLSLTPSVLTVNTSPSIGGGGFEQLQFGLDLYLEVESASTFFLRTLSDPGIQVTASPAGGQPQFVSQVPTLFDLGAF